MGRLAGGHRVGLRPISVETGSPRIAHSPPVGHYLSTNHHKRTLPISSTSSAAATKPSLMANRLVR